jgi:hypothetical protein
MAMPAIGIATGQVPANDIVGHRQESTMGILRALDARLFARGRAPIRCRTRAHSRTCHFAPRIVPVVLGRLTQNVAVRHPLDDAATAAAPELSSDLFHIPTAADRDALAPPSFALELPFAQRRLDPVAVYAKSANFTPSASVSAARSTMRRGVQVERVPGWD